MRLAFAALRRPGPWVLPALLLLLALSRAVAAPAPAPAAEGERTLVLKPDMRQVPLGLLLDVLEDADHRLDIEQLIARGDSLPWRPSGSAVPSFGLSTSAYWLRLRFDNRAGLQSWLLELGYAPLERIRLHLQLPDGTVRTLEGGSALPMERRPVAHARHVFPLDLPPEGTLWIRAHSAGSVSLPLTLWQPAEFHLHDGRVSLAQGAFIGLMLALLLINLIAGAVSRESVHFMYGVSSASYLAYFVSGEGLGQLHFWPAQPALTATVSSVSAALGAAASCLFAYQVLESRRRQCPTGRLLLGLAALSALLSLLQLSGLLTYRTSIQILLVLIGSSCLLLPVTALLAHKRGVAVARYVLFGWLFQLLGVFVTVLRLFGVVPGGLLTEHSASLGFAVGTMLLTMALAVRLRQLKAENEAALADQLRARQAAAQAREEALLAEVGASKAAGLAEALATLEELGRIGREVTGNVDREAVFTTLHRHLQRLMDGHGFALFRVDSALATRSLLCGVEGGRRLHESDAVLSADDPARRCVRERRVVLEGFAPGEVAVASDAAQTLSVMCAPLFAGERLLGVLTVRSTRAQAYGEREVAIFETLCAYAAIALANAETFQALHAAQTRIVQQEKMASLGVLTAGMAHEINNPAHFARLAGQNAAAQVDALRGFIDSLLGADTDPAIVQAFESRFAQIRASLQTSSEGIDRIARVIQRLRAENPEGVGIVEDADVVSLLESAWQTFEPSARVALSLKTNFGIRPTRACAVAEVKQLFLALLGNAHDAIESAKRPGIIALSARERGAGAQREVIIEVRDNGIGIAPPHLDRVFDPFFTTKPVGQGMGLGLSMARGTALRHGWRLHAASVAGEGSVFTLVLPLPEAGSAGLADGVSAYASPVAAQAAGGPPTVGGEPAPHPAA
jgi:signal transduction histidine kinase